MMCVICVLCLIVVPLPPGEKLHEVIGGTCHLCHQSRRISQATNQHETRQKQHSGQFTVCLSVCLINNFCASPAQSLLVPSLTGCMTMFYCHTRAIHLLKTRVDTGKGKKLVNNLSVPIGSLGEQSEHTSLVSTENAAIYPRISKSSSDATSLKTVDRSVKHYNF
jgi:hypothetical protein